MLFLKFINFIKIYTSQLEKIYITAFTAMLGFCVFFRHGVEHSRYILIGLTILFCSANTNKLNNLWKSDSFLTLLFFFAVALTSLLLNSAPLSHIDEVINWIAIFIFGYIASIITQEKNDRFILVIPIALLGAIVIFPVLTGAGWSHLNILSEERLTLFFEQRANHLGLICGMFAFATIYYGANNKGWMRTASFLLSGTCLFLLFRTAARASFLGTALIFTGWLLWKAQKMRKQMLLALSLIIICTFVALFYTPLKNNRIISSVTIGLKEDISFLQRFFTWNVAYKSFRQQPFFGRGFDTFSDQYAEEMEKYKNDQAYQKIFPHTIPTTNNAHNFFLHLLAETGIAGLCAMLLFWATVVRKGFRDGSAISPAVAGMFLISLIAFQMNMSLYGQQISTILFAFAGLSSYPPKNDINALPTQTNATSS